MQGYEWKKNKYRKMYHKTGKTSDKGKEIGKKNKSKD